MGNVLHGRVNAHFQLYADLCECSIPDRELASELLISGNGAVRVAERK